MSVMEGGIDGTAVIEALAAECNGNRTGLGTHRAVVEEGSHRTMTAWDMFLFLDTPLRGEAYLPT